MYPISDISNLAKIKKNILLVAYYFPPLKSGGTKRILNFSKYLKKSGHNVTILTSGYKLSTFKSGIIRIFDISFNKNRKGFKFFIWFPLRLIVEISNMIGFKNSIYKIWEKNVLRNRKKIINYSRPDIIIASYPPVECLNIGLQLSKYSNIPLLSDFRDGLMFEPIESKLLNKYSRFKSLYSTLEFEICKSSAYITSVSKPISDYFRMHYKLNNVYTIYTGFDPDLHKKSKKYNFSKSKLNIVFTGRLFLSDSTNSQMGFFSSIRELIEEEKDFSDRIRIYLCGEFSKKEQKKIEDLSLKGVVINLGYLGRAQTLVLQKSADLLLIVTSVNRKSIVTTKIFEYLMSEKPILALTGNTELANIVKETETGWVFDPIDREKIKSFLKKIIYDRKILNSFVPDKNEINLYSIQNQINLLNSILYNSSLKQT